MMSTQLEQMALSLHEERLREASRERLVREARSASASRPRPAARAGNVLSRLAMACAALGRRIAGPASGPLRARRALPVPGGGTAPLRRAARRPSAIRLAA